MANAGSHCVGHFRLNLYFICTLCVHVHIMYIMYTSCVHRVYIMYTSCVHHVHHVYSMCTSFTLCVHCVHCVYIVCICTPCTCISCVYHDCTCTLCIYTSTSCTCMHVQYMIVHHVYRNSMTVPDSSLHLPSLSFLPPSLPPSNVADQLFQYIASHTKMKTGSRYGLSPVTSNGATTPPTTSEAISTNKTTPTTDRGSGKQKGAIATITGVFLRLCNNIFSIPFVILVILLWILLL